jgi:hypothetical protein
MKFIFSRKKRMEIELVTLSAFTLILQERLICNCRTAEWNGPERISTNSGRIALKLENGEGEMGGFRVHKTTNRVLLQNAIYHLAAVLFDIAEADEGRELKECKIEKDSFIIEIKRKS